MKATWFHHPQYCPRVLARRVTDELLDLLFLLGRATAARGRYYPLYRGFKSSTYYMAAQRLRRQGLVVSSARARDAPHLRLEPEGLQQVSAALHPDLFWRRPWLGRWYVLVYDIPESQCTYRQILRVHLKRLRMGNLQGSVWLSARDVRPDFDDLTRVADLSAYAFLFEAHTVLGQTGKTLAAAAWDFQQLYRTQAWLLETLIAARQKLAGGTWTTNQLLALLREQQSAYLTVMDADPLLPAALWPDGYLGPQVYQAHQELVHAIVQHL